MTTQPNTEPLKVGKQIPFEQMNPLQRRLHNAACVLDADGDEYGYVNLLRETIAELTRPEPSPAEVGSGRSELNLWSNPLFSVDQRLEYAIAEVRDLRRLLDAASSQALSQQSKKD